MRPPDSPFTVVGLFPLESGGDLRFAALAQTTANCLGPSAGTARTQSNVSFTFDFEGGRTAAISLYPGGSSKNSGLRADVRPERLAEAFGVTEESVRAALPPERGEGERVYGEIYHFPTREAVERLVAALPPRKGD